MLTEKAAHRVTIPFNRKIAAQTASPVEPRRVLISYNQSSPTSTRPRDHSIRMLSHPSQTLAAALAALSGRRAPGEETTTASPVWLAVTVSLTFPEPVGAAQVDAQHTGDGALTHHALRANMPMSAAALRCFHTNRLGPIGHRPFPLSFAHTRARRCLVASPAPRTATSPRRPVAPCGRHKNSRRPPPRRTPPFHARPDHTSAPPLPSPAREKTASSR